MNDGNILWADHLEKARRMYAPSPRARRARTTGGAVSRADAEWALRSEWNARPPGRLGRRLLAEVEPYLDFFATARS